MRSTALGLEFTRWKKSYQGRMIINKYYQYYRERNSLLMVLLSYLVRLRMRIKDFPFFIPHSLLYQINH